MKLMVVGAEGQVGSEFALLDTPDCRMVCLGRSELDICDRTQLAAAVKSHRPDYIVNTAAYTAVDKAEVESERAYAVNRDGPENLARVCADQHIPLIHLSTDYVFAGDASTPYTEETVAHAVNVYGQSKLAGEAAIREHCAHHIILRTSWVFGRTGNNFVKTLLRLAAQRDELSVVSDQYGCPTPARDIAAAIVTICQALTATHNPSPCWGIYHFCGAPPTSWYEFARAIFAASRQQGGPAPGILAIPTSAYPTPAQRPRYTVLDCDKLARTFDIHQPDWHTGLDAVVADLLNH